MPSIVKPAVTNPGLERNALGLTVRDYEGGMSTLCAGCGHDSVTAAITQALWETATPPHMIAKLSGIGCSAKTAAYFARGAHGFNGCHGRMPPIATGASAANRDLLCIGISGDGDSLSIGLGHLGHLIRRNVRMLYVLENNGVYGLTKGQFSASADVGSTTKRGEANHLQPIDPIFLGLSLGATFLARGFSGDKRQLVPIFRAAMAHRGLAIVDVISPCVTFNDHEGSTKSYKYVQEHEEAVNEVGFVPSFEDISVDYDPGTTTVVEMHDGSHMRLRKLHPEYNPTSRIGAVTALMEAHEKGEVLTGVFYVDTTKPSFTDMLNLVNEPLATLPESRTRPSRQVLEQIMQKHQ